MAETRAVYIIEGNPISEQPIKTLALADGKVLGIQTTNITEAHQNPRKIDISYLMSNEPELFD